MTVCREIYRKPNPVLRETGLRYQVQLLRAVKSGDGEKAHRIMGDHRVEAERYMLESASTRAPGEHA